MFMNKLVSLFPQKKKKKTSLVSNLIEIYIKYYMFLLYTYIKYINIKLILNFLIL